MIEPFLIKSQLETIPSLGTYVQRARLALTAVYQYTAQSAIRSDRLYNYTAIGSKVIITVNDAESNVF